ncbi:MAG: hypothetical protein ACI4VL_02830 [Bacilli bacterium]
MSKTNKFHVKKLEENNITVEEERKKHSPFILFFIKNGKLIFTISLLLSLAIFIIAISLTLSNIKESSIVMYESNGVVVSFDGNDQSIINGTPITKDYATKVFDSNIEDKQNIGVVIKIKEKTFKKGTIIFYSDKTALVKYTNGEFLRVFPVNNNYGISEEGIINRKAITKKVTGEIKTNTSLSITMLYLSDGSVEVTKENVTFFVRNSDLTSLDNKFYTNLSIVSLPIKKEGNKTCYSNGTIKENNYLLVDNTKYNKIKEITIHNNIKIIYYENNFAEVIKDNLSIIVEKSEHIIYDDNIFEIVDSSIDEEKIDIKDIMDIKNITLENTNQTASNYMIVLEETNNYQKYNITRRLPSEYINYNVYLNGNKINNQVLNNNIKGTSKVSGLSLKNNTYLIYEGKLEKLSTVTVKIGMWVSYETITNEYMNSAFIGTIKVYVESLS